MARLRPFAYRVRCVSAPRPHRLVAAVGRVLSRLPLAFAIARLDIPGKLLLIGLAALPLVLPSFVGAYALLLLFGRAGVVTQFLNSWGVPFGSIYGVPGIVARV